MPFLILSRAGFDDIASRVELAGAVLHLNPGVLADAEVERLRAAGSDVHILVPAVDPRHSDQLDYALRSVERADETLWVERGPPGAAQRPAPALRQRLARNAGMFASAALRWLRNEGGGRQLMLVPYFGFGNAGKLWVKGRVLDEHSFGEQSGEDSG